MNKYQFYLRFDTKPGTAASKAIEDCTSILSSRNYQNLNKTIDANSSLYIFSVLAAVIRLLFTIVPHSILAVQYPLLSGNALFRMVIRCLKWRHIRLIALIHDLNDLRSGESALSTRKSDVALLNDYHLLIVHNLSMKKWLEINGVTAKMIPLQAFDYLAEEPLSTELPDKKIKSIVFAGNLEKSPFIYSLKQFVDCDFKLYGPNIVLSKISGIENVHWGGALSSEEIVRAMEGAFGLIWDGSSTTALDNAYGNYLRYNNPHKLSLYLAAGLPVIVPEDAAVAGFVKFHQIGFTIKSLEELPQLLRSTPQYRVYRTNAQFIGKELREGLFLTRALFEAEHHLQQILTV